MQFSTLSTVLCSTVQQCIVQYSAVQYNKVQYNTEINSKNSFRLSKEILGWKTGKTPSTFHKDGLSVTGQQELAEMQNDYYKNKVKDLIDQLPQATQDPVQILRESVQDWKSYQNIPEFEFIEITETQTLKIMSELSSSTSYGHDTLDSMSIKIAAAELQKQITYVVNLSLKQGKFANAWKIARIVPLFKGKGSDENSPTGYRPISLLATISKVVEKAAQQQLLRYLEKYNMLNQN